MLDSTPDIVTVKALEIHVVTCQHLTYRPYLMKAMDMSLDATLNIVTF